MAESQEADTLKMDTQDSIHLRVSMDSQEDTDEMIEGTQPEILEKKKLIFGSLTSNQQKRKAENASEDEPNSKLSKRNDDDLDTSIRSDDSTDDLRLNPSRDEIIEETQDIETQMQRIHGDCDDMFNVSEKREELPDTLPLDENPLSDTIESTLEDKPVEPAERNGEKNNSKENNVSSKKENDTCDNNGISEDTLADTLKVSDLDTQTDKVEDETETAAKNSRMSIELILEQTSNDKKSKPKEIVEIDEEGEKIILDSSQEGEVADKTNSTVKSSQEAKSSDSSSSAKESDNKTLLKNGSSESNESKLETTKSSDLSKKKVEDSGKTRSIDILPVDNSHEIVSISDSDHDLSLADDSKSKLSLNNSGLNKSTILTRVEREIGVYVKLSCVLQIDENTRQVVHKELNNVHFENLGETLNPSRQRNETSGSLADISGDDNKDSPGSVTSNQQPFTLAQYSRYSMVSTASSSSASSAASLAAKQVSKDGLSQFSLPRVPTKTTKKTGIETGKPLEEYERLSKEWKNSQLLYNAILSYANNELQNCDSHSLNVDSLDEQMRKIHSSTPDIEENRTKVVETPKVGRKSRGVKRTKARTIKSTSRSGRISPEILPDCEIPSEPSTSKLTKYATPKKGTKASNSALQTPKAEAAIDTDDEFLGKEVFAKWSDNNYYPGKVTEKKPSNVNVKYKVKFYDGKSKDIIQDFILLIPSSIYKGLSVYASKENDDSASCGIVTGTEVIDDVTHFVVETDEDEVLKVLVRDISLTSDQANYARERINLESNNLPSTPKHLGKVTLDNTVDGKRRSRRNATPVYSGALESKKRGSKSSSSAAKVEDVPVASGSGMSKIQEKSVGKVQSEVSTTSESESDAFGVQPEITSTTNEYSAKGPQSKFKGKARSKKKPENLEKTLGPLPKDVNLFRGMSFLVTCTSYDKSGKYGFENPDTDPQSEPGTENEEEWASVPLVKERIEEQLKAGGGTVYENFNQIPEDEYITTKLITNIPNTTEKSLLCLSKGISPYNHQWVIRCCQDNTLHNPEQNKLPAGWSIERRKYIEMYQRPNQKPLESSVVVIPVVSFDSFTPLWHRICENAGACVLYIEKPDEDFMEATVILTNNKCPDWVLEKAKKYQIPLISPMWVKQCLVEGKVCPYDTQPEYKYDYKGSV